MKKGTYNIEGNIVPVGKIVDEGAALPVERIHFKVKMAVQCDGNLLH